MPFQTRTSRKATAAFVLGLVSLGAGLLAIVSRTDLFLLGLLGGPLAIVFGVLGLREARRSSGLLTGQALAKWGIGLPIGGLCLGLVFLPAG
jgi:hypothetical protein